MDARLLLDILVSALLVATICYAWMLNRRLDQLRGNRDDMAKVITAFNDATQRAEASIPRLKKAAEDAGLAVQDRVEKAQLLRDDLAFMIERGEALAGRLEEAVRNARAEAPRPAGMSAPTGAIRPSRAEKGEKIERAEPMERPERAERPERPSGERLMGERLSAEKIAPLIAERLTPERVIERISPERLASDILAAAEKAERQERPSDRAERIRAAAKAADEQGHEDGPVGLFAIRDLDESDEERSEAERALLRAMQAAR